jgi:adenylate cyclase
LVDRITAAEAVVIGFDVVFPEPDRSSPELIADEFPGLSVSAREELKQQPSHDQILSRSITRSRVVLGQSAYNPYKGIQRVDDIPRAPFATIGGDPGPYLMRSPNC